MFPGFVFTTFCKSYREFHKQAIFGFHIFDQQQKTMIKTALKSAFAAAAFSLLFNACSNPSTENKTSVTTDSSTVTKKPAAKSALAFKESGLNNAWKNYDNLRDALVKGDTATVQTEAGFLAEALIDVKGAEAAGAKAKELAAASKLSEQRSLFAGMNESFISLVKKSGVNGGELYVQNCPMYAKGKGANWLSSQKEIKNPYYGDEMLECGSVKETIK